MDAQNGIDSGKTTGRKKGFDLFRPVSVKRDGRRIASPNWCVRFQHQGKRTCRSLSTADYRLAAQRAKQLVNSVKQQGWARATVLPTSHGSLSLSDFLERYHRSAVSRGLRPRSISGSERSLRRIAREVQAKRLADLTPLRLQQWVEDCGLKPRTLRSTLKFAACPFSKPSLRALGMDEVQNPFANLVRPKVDHEPFNAPPRSWIKRLMRQGIREWCGDARRAFVLALGAGLRWGEIVSLTWEDVRKDSIRVAAEKAKGRRARVVPVGPLLRRVLETARGQGQVLEGDTPEIHKALCNWLRGQGVNDQKPIHYLRKCFGSMAVADHGVFIASKLLGHSNITQTASTYAGQVDKLPAVKF
jgi:integrase